MVAGKVGGPLTLVTISNGIWPRPSQSDKRRSAGRTLGLLVGGVLILAVKASSAPPLAGQTATRLSPCTTC